MRPVQQSSEPTRVAIACQGGGSQTAFTAGVLKVLLNEQVAPSGRPYRIVGLSGTSGGAICAFFAWYGLLIEAGVLPRPQTFTGPHQPLEDFWAATAATEWWDILLNGLGVAFLQLEGLFTLAQVSPYTVERWLGILPEPLRLAFSFARRLHSLLGSHADFQAVSQLKDLYEVRPLNLDLPRLLIGAADVKNGQFKVFKTDPTFEISADALLASASLPTLFEAKDIGGHSYWDGLFSQNPPIHDFLPSRRPRESKPHEIWVIQINPEDRVEVPQSVADILDRRNELSGNLSLNQEIRFLLRMNALQHKQSVLSHPHFQVVKVRWIRMSKLLSDSLQDWTKLDRDSTRLKQYTADGVEQARCFLAEWPDGAIESAIYPPRIHPLAPDRHHAFSQRWSEIAAQFGQPPGREADEVLYRARALAEAIMDARLYPVADFDDAREDVELEHPIVARHYPPARDFVRSINAGARPSAREYRAAEGHYDALLDDLLR